MAARTAAFPSSHTDGRRDGGLPTSHIDGRRDSGPPLLAHRRRAETAAFPSSHLPHAGLRAVTRALQTLPASLCASGESEDASGAAALDPQQLPEPSSPNIAASWAAS